MLTFNRNTEKTNHYRRIYKRVIFGCVDVEMMPGTKMELSDCHLDSQN